MIPRILILQFFFLSIHLNAQVSVSNMYCENQEVLECLSDVINSADLIVEATLISSFYSSEDTLTFKYMIEKIFKGKHPYAELEVSISRERLLDILFKDTPLEHNKSYLKPAKGGVTSIVLLKKIGDIYEPFAFGIPIQYNFVEIGTKISLAEKTNLVYVEAYGHILKFKTAKELYKYLHSHKGVKCKNITNRKFVSLE